MKLEPIIQSEVSQKDKEHYKLEFFIQTLVFPGGSVVRNPPANAGDLSSVPGWGRFPGEGNVNPLQNSYLGNPMDIGPS